MFVLGGAADVTPATLRGMLYPLWDAGFQVGHAARTPKETIDRSSRDLDAATAILSSRLVAGDPAPFEELIDRRARWLKKDGKRLVRRIVDATAERHESVGRAGWSLAPDLKEDRGGLRDVHALGWLAVVTGASVEEDPGLAAPHEVLLAAREALHAAAGRKLDRLRIDLQPQVAALLGLDGDGAADKLMTQVHSSARVIEHSTAAARAGLAARTLGGPKRSGSITVLAPGVRVEDGVISADPTPGPGARGRALEALAARARTGRALAPATLRWIASVLGPDSGGPEESWDETMRAAFLELLGLPHAMAALETLDEIGAWDRLLPEWLGVRGRAQHDPYHRYTVDGHSFLAVAEVNRLVSGDGHAAEVARDAGDLGPLLLGALLHDVGKGSGEDHSVAGARLAKAACARMGLDDDAAREVVFLVRHHLLLVDTATRRDLGDPDVVARVASIVANARLLRLLLVLSIADGRATGPEGWSEWKGALAGELFAKVLVAIETGAVPATTDLAEAARRVEQVAPELAGRAEALLRTLPHSYAESASDAQVADDLRLLARPPSPGEIRHHVDSADPERTSVAVCLADQRGTLARTAGVLALHRISVLRAQAYSVAGGLALERFVVAAPGPGALDAFVRDLEGAYAGRLAVDARLARKVSDYRPSQAPVPDVRVLQDASEHSTVVEVRAPDVLGLLYAIASGLTDLDLDIHVAKIDTLGSRVVDVFYVRTAWGTKLGPEQAAEVPRSIEHRIARLFA